MGAAAEDGDAAPSRGVVHGCLIGLVLWLAVAGVVVVVVLAAGWLAQAR